MTKYKTKQRVREERVANLSKNDCRAEIAWLERFDTQVQYYLDLKEKADE